MARLCRVIEWGSAGIVAAALLGVAVYAGLSQEPASESTQSVNQITAKLKP